MSLGGQALLGFNYRSASSSYNLVNCRGNESVITDCALTASASMCANYAGVSCYISTCKCIEALFLLQVSYFKIALIVFVESISKKM